MAPAKLNVLVYTGTGTTGQSVRHCVSTLRRLLSPNYAVIPITEAALLREPWASTCALIVVPGGADLGYCRVLNGAGNRLIADFVRRGGAYLGFCAGAYFASARCEFEIGNKPLEVIGSRELAFFPGPCRGGAFRGFQYRSESGARAVKLAVTVGAFDDDAPRHIVSYYNGGGVFVGAAGLDRTKVQVVASYEDELDVDGGAAAVILCRVGDGKALLSGVHPEFTPDNLHPQPDVPSYDDLIQTLFATEQNRIAFLKACLSKLGLESAPQDALVPALTPLHLSSTETTHVSELLHAWGPDIDKQPDGSEMLSGEADVFHIQTDEGDFRVDELRKALETSDSNHNSVGVKDDGSVDYGAIVKKLIAHEKGIPDAHLTPRFDHGLFFDDLKRYRRAESDADDWGNILLYGDVVTSTNSLLEKNPKLISKLPSGFTFTASTQIAGRGRGSNVWVAPPGSLLFSTVINHPAHLAVSHPVVFIQYLAAVAIVEAIQSYGPGYADLPVKLKWPNDIYALDPTKPKSSNSYVKIGGILSQCSYTSGSYQIILGIGLNATNPRPTTSISDLLPQSASSSSPIPPLRLETLLARILTRLEASYADFRRHGFSRDLEARYYRHWLHTGQSVVLEGEAGVRARVLGITRDWGMLRVEEVDREGRGIGRMWSLQSDENSFDFWKGLVKRKE